MAVIVEVSVADLTGRVTAVISLLLRHVVVHKLVPLWVEHDLPVLKLLLQQGNVSHQLW